MSSNALSHAQFAALGAGSRRFSDATPPGSGGYFVSRHPSAGGETRTEGTATPVDVATHWSANKRKAGHSTETYQGLWPNEGHSYLDVSDRVASRGAAIRLGVVNSQKAIYDN